VRRDPVVLVVVALVVALMLVFGLKMARHSSTGMATGNLPCNPSTVKPSASPTSAANQ
jgi:hypothetical protein